MTQDSRFNLKILSQSEAVEAFILDCKARRLAPSTISFYANKLGNFVQWAGDGPLVEVTPQVIRRFLVHLQETGHNPGGQHAHARALRTWLNFLVQEGELDESPMRRVRMPQMPKPSPGALTVGDVQALLDAADNARDVAIILTLLDTGARASELVALNVGDVSDEGAVRIRHGKGDKARTVYMGHRAMQALRRYLRRERRDMLTHNAPLFVSFRGEGVRLTTNAVRLMLAKLAKRAHVARHNPHAFRATFALWSLRSGMDIYTLARLMGHADISTLRHYLALVDSDLADAHRQHGPVNGFYRSHSRRKR